LVADARLAFEEEATIRAVFNKDILLRARRGSKRISAEQAAERQSIEAQTADR
jgi:hypothetical protein